MEISVIIPTFNRKEILEKTLNAFNNQIDGLKRFEVIVVDDGSTDNTINHLKKYFRPRYSLKILSQTNKGPAAARNLGINKAKGKIVLIINDDTIPSPQMINEHLEFHQNHSQDNYALLGLVTWYPELEITPFMYWLENGGPYFNFNSIKGKNAGWRKFWTCNISLKRKFLIEGGLFDETFSTAAWEDVEFGYRLYKNKLRLRYNSEAVGFHYHPTDIKSIKNKMISNGYFSLMLRNKLPKRQLPPLAKYSRMAIILDNIFFVYPVFKIIERIAIMIENKIKIGLLFQLLLLHYRILGLKYYFQHQKK